MSGRDSPHNFRGDGQLVTLDVLPELTQIVEIGDFLPKLVAKKEKRLKTMRLPRRHGLSRGPRAGRMRPLIQDVTSNQDAAEAELSAMCHLRFRELSDAPNTDRLTHLHKKRPASSLNGP